MATGVQAVHDIAERLTFSCAMCMESSDVEFLLYPCLHYGCSDCLERIPKTGNGSSFSCPECRKNITIPYDGLPVYNAAQRVNQQVEHLQLALEGKMPRITPGALPLEEEDFASPLYLEYAELVKNDQRCDRSCRCHRSCRNCGKKLLSILNDTADSMFDSFASFPLIPCRLFTIMRFVTPCFGVFSPVGKVRRESKKVVKMRSDARRAVLQNQTPIFPHPFTAVWAWIMLLVLLYCLSINIYHIAKDENRVFSIVGSSINGVFAILWLSLAIINLTCYRQDGGLQVRGPTQLVSYFAMEQAQQFLSELTMYPPLCLSAMLLPELDKLRMVQFGICSLVLLTAFVLRIYTVNRMKRFVRHFFGKLLVSFIGNYIIVFLLIAILVFVSFTVREHQPGLLLQCSIIALVLITTVWNQTMFYLSHLYEISLQSGLTLLYLHLDGESELGLVRSRISKLTELEVFHKNTYTLSVRRYGIALCFWTSPSIIVLLLFSAYGDVGLTHCSMVLAYYLLLLVVNYKTFLLASAAHFTLFVICFACFAIFPFASLFAMTIYGAICSTVVVLGFLLLVGRCIVCTCKCACCK